MMISLKSVSLIGASLVLLGASLGTAEAMPVAPAAASLQAPAGIEQAAYLRRKHSHRSMSRNAPNRYCQSQPSRCH